MIVNCFFRSFNQEKNNKIYPEKPPENKKHPGRTNLTVATLENKRADLTDFGKETRTAVDADTRDKRFEVKRKRK